MGVVLAYPGFWVRDRAPASAGVVVHGEQRLTVHAPLLASGMISFPPTHMYRQGRGQGARHHQQYHAAWRSGAWPACGKAFCRGGGEAALGARACPPRGWCTGPARAHR